MRDRINQDNFNSNLNTFHINICPSKFKFKLDPIDLNNNKNVTKTLFLNRENLNIYTKNENNLIKSNSEFLKNTFYIGNFIANNIIIHFNKFN